MTRQQRQIFRHVSIFTPTTAMLTQMNTTILLRYGGYLVISDQLALGIGLVFFTRLLDQFAI